MIMVEEDLLPLPRKGVSVIPIRSNFGLLHALKCLGTIMNLWTMDIQIWARD